MKIVILTVIGIFYVIRIQRWIANGAAWRSAHRALVFGEFSLLFIALLQLFDIFNPAFNWPVWVEWIGLAAGFAGVIFSSMARIALKTHYVPAAAAQPSIAIVTTGVYSFIRHPAYLGNTMAFFGFEIAMKSALIVLPIIYLLVIIRQIEIEEKMLSLAHPENWLAYSKETRYKLLPHIY